MKKWQIPVIIVLAVGLAVLISFLAKQTKTKTVAREEILRELYDKVQELEPPIDFSENLNSNSFYFIKGNDSLIFSNESMVLGALKDTSRFFTFVQIGSGDSYYPIL